jgi:hypothetical protein
MDQADDWSPHGIDEGVGLSNHLHPQPDVLVEELDDFVQRLVGTGNQLLNELLKA